MTEAHRQALAGADAPEDRQPELPIGEELGLRAPLGSTPRRVGRPPGAKNRATLTFEGRIEQLVARYGHPVDTAFRVLAMGVDELAQSLGCKPIEALQEQRLWWQGLMPFVESRKPVAVDLSTRNVVHLTIQDGAAPAEEMGELLEGSIVEVVENQQVTEG